MNRESISVTALNRYVKSLLESDEVLSQIWVEGEISGFKLHTASGHMYFRLIDKHCSVKCVMFYGYASKLKFMPEEGMKVLVCCDVSLYEVTGDFQLYVKNMVEKGAGDRKTKLDLLKEKLQSQGLFDVSRKRQLVRRPKTISVITSESGAAIQDIINVMSRRDPFVELRLYSSNVQGAFAVDSICRMIDSINRGPELPDLVIITRGGGSKDNLWIFNEEKLVLAASRLKVPFISAVGHEIDITLLDLIADLRAPTPSAAAELAVPDLAADIESKQKLILDSAPVLKSKFCFMRESVNQHGLSLNSAASQFFEAKKNELERVTETCSNLSPLRLLKQGYVVAMKNGEVIRSARDICISDQMQVRMFDGIITCTVDEVETNEI